MGSAPELPPRPTLEELLRYKRCERPSPAFWAEFDRGLRQKQLSALMKQPKGWAKLRPLFARSLKWTVPATAAAAVALVVFQIPFSSASRQAPVEVASVPVRSGELAVSGEAGRSDARVASAELARPVPQTAPAAVAVATGDPVAVPVAGSAPVGQVLPWSAASLMPELEEFALSEVAVQEQPVARDDRRHRSSWTSRYNTLARDIAAGQTQERTLQLVAYDLQPEARSNLGRASTESALALNTRVSREPDERVLRSLEARLGASSSRGLAIKF